MSNEIKTWQERIVGDLRTYAVEVHMKAEIHDLRVALAVALASREAAAPEIEFDVTETSGIAVCDPIRGPSTLSKQVISYRTKPAAPVATLSDEQIVATFNVNGLDIVRTVRAILAAQQPKG